METKRILVVDDEPDICEILSLNLTLAGYKVATANSAKQALDMNPSHFDLLLLDVMMDGMSGFEMMEEMKKNPNTENTPVLFITAKDTEEDILSGFELGADDYISKPFSVKEVLARVKAVLARTDKGQNNQIVYKDMKVDLIKKVVTVKGKELPLTKTEYDILKLFVSNPGVVFSRHKLIERIWPKDVIVTDRTVDVNITRLRKKMVNCPNSICTRQGFGYYLE